MQLYDFTRFANLRSGLSMLDTALPSQHAGRHSVQYLRTRGRLERSAHPTSTYRFSSSCLVVKYPSSPFSRSALQLKVCEVVDQVVSLLINKFGSVGESFLQLKGRYISERVVEIYRPLDRSGGAWISTAQRRWRYRYRIRSAIPMD